MPLERGTCWAAPSRTKACEFRGPLWRTQRSFAGSTATSKPRATAPQKAAFSRSADSPSRRRCSRRGRRRWRSSCPNSKRQHNPLLSQTIRAFTALDWKQRLVRGRRSDAGGLGILRDLSGRKRLLCQHLERLPTISGTATFWNVKSREMCYEICPIYSTEKRTSADLYPKTLSVFSQAFVERLSAMDRIRAYLAKRQPPTRISTPRTVKKVLGWGFDVWDPETGEKVD